MPDRVQAYDAVGVMTDVVERFDRCDRHGKHDPCRALALERDQGGTGRGPGRQAIVDDDGGAPGRIHARPASQVQTAPAFELEQLAAALLVKVGVVGSGLAPDVLVDDGMRLAPLDDGAQRQFRCAWRADLAHQHQVERGIQAARDRHGHGHAPARQCIDDGALRNHGPQSFCQLATGIGPVGEEESRFHAAITRRHRHRTLIWIVLPRCKTAGIEAAR